jgi:REP element-mobilizing transposase RayT
MRQRKEHYRHKLPHFQQPGQWYSVTFTLVGAMPKGAMDNYSLQLEIARNRLDELLGQELSKLSGFQDRKVGDSNLAKLESRESDFSKSDLKNFDLGKSKSRKQEFLCSESFDLGKSKSRLEKAKKDYQIALRKYSLAFDKILNTSNSPNLSLIKEMNRNVIEEALLFWEGKRLTNHAWCIMTNHVHWVLSVSKNGGNGMPVYLEDILHSVKLFTARRINENENKTGQFWEHESFDTTIRDERHFSNVFNYVINNPVAAGLVADWHDWLGTRAF